MTLIKAELQNIDNGDQSRLPRLEPRAILAWWQSASLGERVELIHSFGAVETWDALAEVID